MADKMKRLYILAIDAINTKYTGDAGRIENKFFYTEDAVVHCYIGDQTLWKTHSFDLYAKK